MEQTGEKSEKSEKSEKTEKTEKLGRKRSKNSYLKHKRDGEDDEDKDKDKDKERHRHKIRRRPQRSEEDAEHKETGNPEEHKDGGDETTDGANPKKRKRRLVKKRKPNRPEEVVKEMPGDAVPPAPPIEDRVEKENNQSSDGDDEGTTASDNESRQSRKRFTRRTTNQSRRAMRVLVTSDQEMGALGDDFGPDGNEEVKDEDLVDLHPEEKDLAEESLDRPDSGMFLHSQVDSLIALDKEPDDEVDNQQAISRLEAVADGLARSNHLMLTMLMSDKHLDARSRETISNRSSYDTQQRVAIKVTFSRVGEIDTLGQQFSAEVHIQARWVEKHLQGKTEKELEEIPFSSCWDPRLVIVNLVGGMDRDRLSIMVRYEEDEVYPIVTYLWVVKASFMETLELEHFPFDTQELSIVLSSERPMDEIDLVPDNDNISNVSPIAILDSQEWKSFRHVEFTNDFRSGDTSSMHPVLIASAHVRRRLGFYMWNIFIIIFLIISLSLTILSIDPTGGDRLGVTMTLFLTTVAFKLVVKTTVPHISYLTYLDIYVVFTMMYLAAQAFENAIISHLARFRNRDKVILWDEIAQSTLIGLLILFHAVFLIYIRLTAFSRRREMDTKDHAYHLKVMKKKKRDSKDKEVTKTPANDYHYNPQPQNKRSLSPPLPPPLPPSPPAEPIPLNYRKSSVKKPKSEDLMDDYKMQSIMVNGRQISRIIKTKSQMSTAVD